MKRPTGWFLDVAGRRSGCSRHLAVKKKGYRLLIRFLVTTVLLGATLHPAMADEERSLATRISDAIELHNSVSESPLPVLTPEQLEQLLAGKVVELFRRLSPPPDDTDVRYRIAAFHLVEFPRDWAWLASLDPHLLGGSRVRQVRLEEDGRGGGVSYGFLSLPWPLRDRHWLVRHEPEVALAKATNGRIWERTWQPAEGGEKEVYEFVGDRRIEGLTLKAVKRRVYLPFNTGAWTFCALDESHTLIAYEVTIASGGGFAGRFAKKHLSSLLRTVASNAAKMRQHYDPSHKVLFGGDGLPIPPLQGSRGLLSYGVTLPLATGGGGQGAGRP